MAGQNRLQWVFELLDRMSTPARGMAKALGSIEAGFGKAWHSLKEGIHVSHDILETMNILWERTAFIREAIGEVLQERRFKDNALIALEALTGSRDAAIDLFERTESFAGRTGQNVQQLVRQTTELKAAGYGAQEIGLLNQAISDVGVVGGSERAGALAEAIHRIGLEGKLTERAMRGLKGAGVSTDTLFKELATTFHTSTAVIKKALGSTGIEKQAGVFALLETIKKQFTGGKDIGTLTDRMSKTLGGALDRVKLIPHLVTSALFGFADENSPVARFLTNLADTFAPDSESGQRIITRIKQLGERLLEAFGIGGPGFLDDLAGPNGMKKIEEIFSKFADSVEESLPALRAIGNAIIAIGKGIAFALETVQGAGALAGAAVYGSDSNYGFSSFDQQKRQNEINGLLAEIKRSDLPAERRAQDVNRLQQLHVAVHVDARGATKDAADHIARKVAEETTSNISHALAGAAVESGAY